MKLEPCPNCGGTNIKYSGADCDHYCADCNTWPLVDLDPEEQSAQNWNAYAKGDT